MKTLATRPSNRTLGCAAIVEFLTSIWPLTARRAELSYVFIQADPHTTATCTAQQRVNYALRNLVKSGDLECFGESANREWAFKQPTQPVTQPKPAVAAPRRDSLCCSPLYQPKPWPINRAGAQDFKTVPSVGVHC